MKSHRRLLPVVLMALATSLALPAAVQAQPAERSVRLDESLEQKIENAVVYVSVEYAKPNSTHTTIIESGSGFFIAPGYIVTNHHVIANDLDGTADLKVRVFSGTSQSRFYDAEIVKSDERADLALLHIIGDAPAIEPIRIDPNLPGKQSEVFAFGFPLGTMLDRSKNGPNVCLRRGYISRAINDGSSLEADLNIDKGISGGPLVDENGMVRGVVRAMAGSDYNKSYAGISVSSAVLVAFCQNGGCRVTLSSGQVVEPQTQAAVPVIVGQEPAPRPRAGLDEDLLRAFFTVGSALRLSSLVPQLLTFKQSAYSADIRQTSRNNADLVLSNLRKVQAPEELLQRTRELGKLVAQPEVAAKLVGEKAVVLEQACDEWVKEAEADEKLNYDLGAWLTELSLGLVDVKQGKDLRSCEYFIKAAQDQEATTEVMGLLTRLQSSLTQLKQKDTDELRRAITKDADRLIGIGCLATTRNLNPIAKPSTPPTQDDGANNQIRPPE